MALLPKSKTNEAQEGSSQDELPQRIVLDDASFEAFSAAMENPSPPTAKLRELFAKK